MSLKRIRWGVLGLGTLGVATIVLLHVLIFFGVPTESFQGVVQRIFYIHVPAWWITFSAFGVVALCSAVYLWLGDDRLDAAAVAAAEGGMVFCTIGLLTGPLWARVAWGAWWTWEPRLTLALLLWFIFLGYFMVRASTEDPEKGKRFAAVIAIVGALHIPLIHMSVIWFRDVPQFLHPQPVVVKPEGPTLDGDMLTVLLTSFGVFTMLFLGLFLLRYALETVRAEAEARTHETTA